MSYRTAQTTRKVIIFAVLLSLIVAFAPRITAVSAGSKPKKENKVASGPGSTDTSQNVSKNFGNLPLSFEPNHGQADKRVKFLSRGLGHSLFLTGTEAWIALNNSRNETQMLRMNIVGGNKSATVSGESQLPGRSNYLMGKRQNWKTDLKTFGKVRASQVYPGIDVVYYGSDQRQFEYDFIVSPNVDPRQIRLAFDGVDEMHLDDDGGLHLTTKAGEVVQPAPYIYQEIDGQRQKVDGRFVLSANHKVEFEISEYDRNRTLVIDPQLVYASYHGGSGDDRGEGITVDKVGNAYITGSTLSADLPLNTALQVNQTGMDAFVVKVNASGTATLYSTYLGGNRTDFGEAIAVMSDGKACLTGGTDTVGENFPLLNEYQGDPGIARSRNLDVFVTVLTPAGNGITYSTFIGGYNVDNGHGIAVDAFNNIYVGGTTLSDDFPTKHEFQNRNDSAGAFVAKFDPDQQGNDSLVYSSFFGGERNDYGEAIAVTTDGTAFVTGSTDSRDFPVKSSSSLPPLQSNFGGGEFDGFVVKVSSSGELIYSTYFGGDGRDEGIAIAVDANERAYVTGFTDSSAQSFPLKNAFDSTRAGSSDAFVAKFNADGTTLFYSSFITGGGSNTKGKGIGVDAGGSAYVTGFSSSSDIPFPVVNGFPASVPDGGAFIVKVGPSDATGTTVPQILLSDTLRLGNPASLALDKRGNIYIAGSTGDRDAATTDGAFQETFAGGPNDAIVLKITSTIPDTIGVYRPGTRRFFLRNSNTAGNPDIHIEFGEPGDLPIAGDWDGDGETDVGVFRPERGQFLLRVRGFLNQVETITINFGSNGDLPVAGDWNGDGIDTPGVFRPDRVGTFLLTNSIADGSAPSPDEVFTFGVAGDLPVAGDWDGDTIDTVGVFRPGSPGGFFLANEFQNVADIFFNFGTAGDLPLAGDWTGKGNDTVGVFRPSKSTMFLANDFANVADIFFVFGQSIDKPVAGNWDGQ